MTVLHFYVMDKMQSEMPIEEMQNFKHLVTPPFSKETKQNLKTYPSQFKCA